MAKLSPSQQEAFDYLLEALPIGSVFNVWTRGGFGTTTILQELHQERGGELVSLKSYIDDMRTQDPFRMEETLENILMSALERSDMVIMDDLHLLYQVICGCRFDDHYPRSKFADAILTSVIDYAVKRGKKLVLGNNGKTPGPVADRCYHSGFKKFTVEDYKAICLAHLGKHGDSLDYAKIHRFAPKLNAHQLKGACLWLKEKPLGTDKFIDYLRSQRMVSNVDLQEVEPVDLRSLRGLDDLIDSLEANIIIPLEQDELASEFGIKPKRGVLLAGPPGTGKTTVGRALAHRLKSKFFLIDGTFISGSRDFYQKIQQIFEAAKNNAPSIIFIDDSDIIFEDKDDFGLYRYLLTMLDGLEGESNKRICVMMTTMDVSSVPPALVRSGRIELWLETRLPDKEARLHILKDNASNLPAEFKDINFKRLADETEGLTGADLRRLIEDGKILYAYDKAKKVPVKKIDDYLETAIKTIRSNKEKYASAEEKSRAKLAQNPAAALMGRFMSYRPSYGGDDD